MMKRPRVVSGLLILVAFFALCGEATAAGKAGFDKLQKAIRTARAQALVPPDEAAAMAGAVRGYLGSIDPYSTYITAEEYVALHNAPKQYGGVGMELIQGPGGILYCLPHSTGPAAESGVRPGDVLFAVDGMPVARYPLQVLEGRIRGKPGSLVTLGLVSAGKTRTVTLKRAVIAKAGVELVTSGRVPRIRIWRFDESTPGQLRECLAAVPPDGPLILDVRGNVGGNLRAAVACADVLLPDESLIATLEDREGKPKVFRAGSKGKVLSHRLALWQDGFTASAAELFCAALRENGRAASFGQTSFGKGVAQSIIAAGDKDFFIITTGRLLGPEGAPFHDIGLHPDYYISPNWEPVEQYYTRRTYEVFGIAP